ncbi:MAG: peptidoglycan DD-metalloendopeptidase family protein [Gammaproteobacteria bacterium]|nr:peptidoglycan DD-metalloendopeptidase family protein [Gammaproteobacteria bacterium]
MAALAIALRMLPLLLAVLMLAGAARAQEQSAAEVRQSLENIQQQIRVTRARQTRTKGQIGYLETELARLETQIGEVARRLRGTQQTASTLRTQLEKLAAREQLLLRDLRAQRGALAAQVRAAYAMGRQEKVKMLLNQQDPHAVGRLLVYYDYINRARGRRIDQASRTLTELARIEQMIGAERARLADVAGRLRQQQTSLRTSRSRRGRVLAALTQDAQHTDNRLAALAKDRTGLRDLLASIRQALADARTVPADDAAFESLKGSLPWPSTGPVVTDFGMHDTETEDVIWQGVFIDANRGADVQSVASGTVVFADWMRGFGLLIIVDHGDGYMSLYGHNQSLYKSVGDRAGAGELIGHVGDSGGLASSGLYFEIRHEGTPLDPLAWFDSPG